MRASLLIAAHNEGESLWKTIRACVETTYDLSYEIIVADDASSDGSIENAVRSFPQVRVVRHPERLGASPTKHAAALEAKSDVLVFLDGHSNPEFGAIQRLVQGIEEVDGKAILTPAVPNLDTKEWLNSRSQVGHGYAFDLETLNCRWLSPEQLPAKEVGRCQFHESPALIGCAFAVSRALYQQLNGFDTDMRFWGVEDIDFGLKSLLMGFPILHDSQALVGHRFRQSFDNYVVPNEHIVANQLRFARKHFTSAVWSQWVEACRLRSNVPLTDCPEGLWARAWQLFEDRRASVEQERSYLQGRRVHDEFWYAEKFSLGWPRLSARSDTQAPTNSTTSTATEPNTTIAGKGVAISQIRTATTFLASPSPPPSSSSSRSSSRSGVSSSSNPSSQSSSTSSSGRSSSRSSSSTNSQSSNSSRSSSAQSSNQSSGSSGSPSSGSPSSGSSSSSQSGNSSSSSNSSARSGSSTTSNSSGPSPTSSSSSAPSDTSSSSSSSAVISFTLSYVTFGSADPNSPTGWTVLRDTDSSAYAPKQWNKDPSQRFPFLFLKSSFLYVSEVQWSVQNGAANANYQIRAFSPDLATPITNWLDATYDAPTATLTADSITTTFQFPATTKFYNPLSIIWQVRVNQGQAKAGGTSANPIYVCLTGPITVNINNQPVKKPALYRSVVHLGCSVSGAVDLAAAISNTWGLLSNTATNTPSNFCGWKEQDSTWSRELFYYKPGLSWLQNPQPGTETKELLSTQDGACYNWCWLFYDSLIINGGSAQVSNNSVQSVTIRLDPLVVGQPAQNTANMFVLNDFLVFMGNQWQANKNFGQLDFDYGPYANPGTFPDMTPIPADSIYGDFKSQDTIKGQNTAPPAQKIFIDHLIVKCTVNGASTFYDPSYGCVYAGGTALLAAQSFLTNSVLGYANSVARGDASITVKQSIANMVLFDTFNLPY